jgi:cell division septation protein DedD
MQTDLLATSLATLLVLFLPQPTAAQHATLDRADSLLRAGQIDQARSTLEQWQKTNVSGAAASSNQARATYLKARLATRADSAEDAYLTVALSHATSRYAPESLLRLGQARMASGDAIQAIVYLQRLITDYPRSEQRPLGALWLARAQIAAHRSQAACVTINSALQRQQTDSETTALLRAEQSAACTRAVTAPAVVAPSPAPRFAIQVGAFRERARARALAHQIEKAGFEEVRVATVPENALLRVRIGRYDSAAVAAATIAKLKAAGFSAVVVADRQREKIVGE